MNVDLHCHSTISDGCLSPRDVVRRACANGVELLALTDHDALDGVAEAALEAQAQGLRFVAGVEVTTSFIANQSVHIVGLGVDATNPELLAGIERLRSVRDARAVRVDEALQKVGIFGTLEGARRFAANPALLGRAHFARYLVASGVMPDVATAFKYYLSPGKPGFIAEQWATLEEAVSWIRGAGGVAVVAHPGRYHSFSTAQLSQLFDEFVAVGGEAIEVVAGGHTPEETKRFATVARRRGLLASRGSDFHDEHESVVDVGRCNPLPPDLTPIWTRFA